jgi:hypothetical protein
VSERSQSVYKTDAFKDLRAKVWRRSIHNSSRVNANKKTEPDADSPLSLLVQEPELHQLIGVLKSASQERMENPGKLVKLVFSRQLLELARSAFAHTILQGELKLHQLSQLLAKGILGSDYEISSSVVGKLPSTGERFTLARTISLEELLSSTDLDLGNRELERLRVRSDVGWEQAELVANFVHYEGKSLNAFDTLKLISRIKAEQAIWNKVVDHIFEFDKLVKSDKQLKHLSPFVKDIFGIKLLTSDEKAAFQLQDHLLEWEWDDLTLAEIGIAGQKDTRRLQYLEVKDYLTAGGAKKSGWKAIKSVVRWSQQTFEIQIQPLASFYRERERFTRESHRGFKVRREQLRGRVARELPIFGYYHQLLKWMFVDPTRPKPFMTNFDVELVD